MPQDELTPEQQALSDNANIPAGQPGSPWSLPPGGDVTTLSSEGAVDTVNGANETLEGLSPTTAYAVTPGGIQSNKTGKFYNTPEEMYAAESESSENTDEEGLADIFAGDEETTAAGNAVEGAQAEADTLQADLGTLLSEIDSFKITDQQLNEQISAISSRWNARITEMRDINQRREKAFETLGFRTGAQFSGGVRGGVFGGVIAEEERQGVTRIGSLEAEKQAEISAARSAQREANWSIYVQKVNNAQDAYDKQLEEVKKLNDIYIARQKEVEAERKAIEKVTRQSSIDSAVAGLWNQGITDPAMILDYLNYSENGEMVGDISIAEIKDAVELFDKMKPEEFDPLEGVSTDVKSFAAMFPDLEIGTPEFQQTYLRWKAQEAAAGRAPKEPTSKDKNSLLLSQIAEVLDPEVNPQIFGGDGFIFDTDYNRLANEFIRQGGNIADFNESFARYLSPVNRTKWLDKATGFKAMESDSGSSDYSFLLMKR